jgi:murein DD-endopeptidase MepM/ murein hydrolase activator NlpD
VPSFDAQPSHRLNTALILAAVAALAVLAFAFVRGGAPRITALDAPAAIGARRMISFGFQDSAGIASVEAHYVQGGQTIPIARRTFSPRRWFSTGDAPPVARLMMQAGRAAHPELKDGPAELVVTARAANLRGAQSTYRQAVTISSHPPSVYAMTARIYLAQGGSAVVVYHVSDNAARSGVAVDGDFFPGYPLPDAAPGGAGRTMFAFFALPYNAPPGTQPVLQASDAAGNTATAALPVRIFPQKFRSRTLPIDDSFIARVVMPIIANTPSLQDQHNPLKNFLLVNHTLRRTDAEELVQAAKLSVPRMLWHGPFTELSHAAVEADFADHRSYLYHGKIVDQEDHLGYDLAVVRHTPVTAANAGRVIWTKYFGIYGNCVLIDHGYGLMSLYAHLNDFQVKPGAMVAQGELIAHSDSTGLAGGDHLHFSMLLNGVQVDPIEWWDPHWVSGRILAKLARFQVTPAAAGAKP